MKLRRKLSNIKGIKMLKVEKSELPDVTLTKLVEVINQRSDTVERIAAAIKESGLVVIQNEQEVDKLKTLVQEVVRILYFGY